MERKNHNTLISGIIVMVVGIISLLTLCILNAFIDISLIPKAIGFTVSGILLMVGLLLVLD